MSQKFGVIMNVANNDYQSTISELVRRPEKFTELANPEDLLPNLGYKIIWAYISRRLELHSACEYIVGVLHLAVTENCERELAQAILDKLDEGEIPLLSALQAQFKNN